MYWFRTTPHEQRYLCKHLALRILLVAKSSTETERWQFLLLTCAILCTVSFKVWVGSPLPFVTVRHGDCCWAQVNANLTLTHFVAIPHFSVAATCYYAVRGRMRDEWQLNICVIFHASFLSWCENNDNIFDRDLGYILYEVLVQYQEQRRYTRTPE